jgi:hypothetical protein
MKTTFKLNEQVTCLNPDCGKPLEDGKYGEAHCFIVSAPVGEPMKLGGASRSSGECGWCNVGYEAVRTGKDAVEFTFNEYAND